MESFSYIPDVSFSEKLTLLMPVLMWSLCYSLHDSFSLKILKIPSASFAMSFIYNPDDRFSEE